MIEPVYMKPYQRKRKMNSTVSYINEWQTALQSEILYLKKFGSTKYRIFNGRSLVH